MTSLIERFTSRTGKTIRVQRSDGEPIFCAKDVCHALGIVNYRTKVSRLDEDESRVSLEQTTSGRQNMVFVTEPGLYKIILTCRGATVKGTPAHSFTRWVTHEVLPAIRHDREYKLREAIAAATKEEKGRRLWIVLRDMDIWNFNARRKHFGKICRATTELCYTDEFGAPHVCADRLRECKNLIRDTMTAAILEAMPEDQKVITDFFVPRSSQ